MESRLVKCLSTGKPRAQEGNLTKFEEYSSYQRLVQTEVKKKGHEKLMPMKIADLLGPSEYSKSAQKDTVQKKLQPERMTMYVHNESTLQNRNMAAPFDSNQATCYQSRARRNLNFKPKPVGVENNLKQLSNDTTTLKKEVQLIACKKFGHIVQNREKKDHLEKHNTKTSRYSKIPTTSASKRGTATSTNNIKDYNTKNVHLEDKLKSLKVSSLMPQNNDKSKDSAVDSLQNAKLLELSNDTSTKPISSGTIQIKREQLIDLKCSIQQLISTLQSTVLHVTKLLSADKKEGPSETTAIHKTTVNEEVEIETCCKAVQVTQADLTVSVLHAINDVNECLSTNLPINSNEDEKENHETNANNMPNPFDDSFLRQENQLNIVHCIPLRKDLCNMPISPATIKENKKVGDKSMSEYLALKSSMNFLVTPEPKRIQSVYNQNNTIDIAALHKKNLSDRVLKSLCNLYEDSPNHS